MAQQLPLLWLWVHCFTGLVCFCGGCAKYTHGASLSTLFHRLCCFFVAQVKLVLQPGIGCLYCCNSCASCLLISFIICNANFQNCFALYLYFSSAWYKLLPHIPLFLLGLYFVCCPAFTCQPQFVCLSLSSPPLSPTSPSPSPPFSPIRSLPSPLFLLSCFPPYPLGYRHQYGAYKYIFMFLCFLTGTLFCFFPRHSPRQCSKWGWR